MKVGIPKEIKDNEYRVGMTQAGVELLVKAGHPVFVQVGAGEGTAIDDTEYQKAGATILQTAAEIYQNAEMIVKVKEPLEHEFPMLRKDHILFTYLHLASDRELTIRTASNKSLMGRQVKLERYTFYHNNRGRQYEENRMYRM